MYPVFLLDWIYNPGEVNISIYNAIILSGLKILIFIAVGLQIRLSGGSRYQPWRGLYLVALLLAGLSVRGHSPANVVDAHDVRPSAVCQRGAAHELAVNGLDDGPAVGGRVDAGRKEAGEL